ncbi:hypothetical protein [Gimesia aquarii]|uniref:Uncharacterized protein n=1 Tax=Gimesia aquarii TaxID=2527964 RepID=A0A517WV30_9PLAN|nr:hypothetical protein [Gimesia aquarii]QDU09104.1 hypothetical protein V202x_24760 [Gimesia aquarii]
MTNQIMDELRNGLVPASNSVELINAVVDRLLELNIDLQEVSLDEMKTLMSSASSLKAKENLQNRSRHSSGCAIAS